MNILVVEDDEEIRSLLSDYLVKYGFDVHCAEDDVSMHRQLTNNAIDLVILDLTLRFGIDGLVLACELREKSNVAIIILSGRSSPYDRILGLEKGADDYIIKPFEPRELVSRIKAVMRLRDVSKRLPANSQKEGVTCFEEWELHCKIRCLYAPDGSVIALSATECRLLYALLSKPRKALSREQLLLSMGRDSRCGDERGIDLLVSRLRKKILRTSGGQMIIRTLRGTGYLLDVTR